MLLGAIPAEVSQIAVYISQCNRPDQANIDIHNRDFVQIQIPQRAVAGLLDVAENCYNRRGGVESAAGE